MRPLDTLRFISQPIAYHPALAKHVGGVTTAIFLGQLIYWDGKGESELGTHKTSEEWEAETGLSYREQASARKKLRALGLLIETEQRLKHRIYYKLNHEAFNAFFEALANPEIEEKDDGEGGESANNDSATPQLPEAQSPNDDNAIGEQPKTQSGDDAKRNPLIDTKTTTVITTKNTCDSPSRTKYSESFNRFWLAYPNTPRRVAKAKCFDVWRRKKLDDLADELITHVSAMAKTKAWQDGYEPAPLTYLNQDRWEDGLPGPEVIAAKAAQFGGHGFNKQEALEARNREIARMALMGGQNG